MKSFVRQLIDNFRDRAYRESLAAEHLNATLSQQIAAVRQQRGLSQQELAKLVGTKQPGIARMERSDYGRANIATLQKIALALDCRLKVTLETYSSLLEESVLDDETALLRAAFDDDPLFRPGAVGDVRRKLVSWLYEAGSIEHLDNWLQGFELPLAGDEEPYQWLAAAVEGIPRFDYWKRQLAIRLREYLDDFRWRHVKSTDRKSLSARNAFLLAEWLRDPDALGEPVWKAHEHPDKVPLKGAKEPWPEHPMTRALTYNQAGINLPEVQVHWKRFVERAGTQVGPLDISRFAAAGLIGSSRLAGPAPYARGAAEAARMANEWSWSKSRRKDSLDGLKAGFEFMWRDHQDRPALRLETIEYAANSPGEGVSWSQGVMSAWYLSVRNYAPPTGQQGMGLLANAARFNSAAWEEKLTAMADSTKRFRLSVAA